MFEAKEVSSAVVLPLGFTLISRGKDCLGGARPPVYCTWSLGTERRRWGVLGGGCPRLRRVGISEAGSWPLGARGGEWSLYGLARGSMVYV